MIFKLEVEPDTVNGDSSVPPPESINLEELEKAKKITIPDVEDETFKATGSKMGDQLQDQIEEIADDMLDLTARLSTIEQVQVQNQELLKKLVKSVQDSGRAQAMELDGLRRELVSDQKTNTSRNAFNAVIGVLNSLEIMREGLIDEQDKQVKQQVSAVVSLLRSLIHSMGFQEVAVAEGDSFDPQRMECVGYLDGDSGVVLKVSRQGYCVGENIVCPCGVYIANPASGKKDNKEEK